MAITIKYVIFEADEFKAALENMNLSAVARAVGVSPPTIARLARGDVDEVSVKTRADVTDFFKKGKRV